MLPALSSYGFRKWRGEIGPATMQLFFNLLSRLLAVDGYFLAGPFDVACANLGCCCRRVGVRGTGLQVEEGPRCCDLLPLLCAGRSGCFFCEIDCVMFTFVFTTALDFANYVTCDRFLH